MAQRPAAAVPVQPPVVARARLVQVPRVQARAEQEGAAVADFV
jgi:hypothetical protein